MRMAERTISEDYGKAEAIDVKARAVVKIESLEGATGESKAALSFVKWITTYTQDDIIFKLQRRTEIPKTFLLDLTLIGNTLVAAFARQLDSKPVCRVLAYTSWI